MAIPQVHEQTESLAFVAEAFQNFRNSSGKVRHVYPLPLRRRAVALVESGIPSGEVASECGIWTLTLKKWQDSLPPLARRLAVVPEKRIVSDAEVLKSEEIVSAQKMEAPVAPMFRFQLLEGLSCEARGEDAVWLIRALRGER
jgi:hypothetical protein